MNNIKNINIDCDDKELKAAMETMKRTLNQRLEFNNLIAIEMKSKYDNYIKVGFNPHQALELCKTALIG